ncbi:hypothetical protein AMTRI_Chr10g231600 [Amborella trichopoda]
MAGILLHNCTIAMSIPNCTTLRKPIPRTSIASSFLHSSFQKCTLTRVLHSKLSPNSKMIKAMGTEPSGLSGFSGLGGSDLPVELCETRRLPPALTFRDAVDKLKMAIEELKLRPPCSRSGVLRFQVPLSSSVKAFDWLALQTYSLEGPQFGVHRDDYECYTSEKGLISEMLGVAGIGAAVYFRGTDSFSSQELYSIQRFLSLQSPSVRAFGLVCQSPINETAVMQHEIGSFYFFIPQIEVDELGNVSIMAGTLAWDVLLHYSFEEAVNALELSLSKMVYFVSPTKRTFSSKWLTGDNQKSDLAEGKSNVKMVCLSAYAHPERSTGADYLTLEQASTFDRFYFQLSRGSAYSQNMIDTTLDLNSSVKECSNINSLWASLIVEECCRLGLKFFCIAPGSRSSALAVSAASHPHTTCISCFDERSLAFHAVGYARGSHKPAVIITSSGTAVSNLLPAVVEASYDCIPVLLLTADRPPELQDTGANQAINQVNHFGSFVRCSFSLPPPDDRLPARMVLTTIDSAVHRASETPSGPVHINCPFREPLASIPTKWNIGCLKGLGMWLLREDPFTKYLRMPQFLSDKDSNDILGDAKEVLDIIQFANQGLLLIGNNNTEDEIWAALLLAKHLSWPVIPDILSGLRLRKIIAAPEEEDYLFVDHLDHALLADSVRRWAQPDVVVQIGSRLTSKRIAQWLEDCLPHSYIVVDEHPFRHDPSHIITHRIQCTITEFVDPILKLHCPVKTSKWSSWLQALNMAIAWEIRFQIDSDESLTEPYVAQVISEALSGDSALFVGNSMVIRDADMYGLGWFNCPSGSKCEKWSLGLPWVGIRIAGNRGASGIDGLLSTAVGFAIGSNKRVLLVVGDISLLHDTNGLAILNQRVRRKPMTILVINNHGGAIFSLLPVADRTRSSILNNYFYTSHNVSVRRLCEAHRLKHVQVRTKRELQHALSVSHQGLTDSIIEVASSIKDNAAFHRVVQQSAGLAAEHALDILSRLSKPEVSMSGVSLCKIQSMEYLFYRIQLCSPPTYATSKTNSKMFNREGYVLTVAFEDGSTGIGEVAPVDIHKEDLLAVEEQLRFLLHITKGVEISYLLPMLNGSFSLWLWRCLGLPHDTVSPSVRCGLEMAILNALAARHGSNMLEILLDSKKYFKCMNMGKADPIIYDRQGVQTAALLDSDGSPEEVAQHVAQLAEEGFTTIKLKVARRANPSEDVDVVRAIRQRVGYQINLRVDANRSWTYEEAVYFGSSVKDCALQFIEEPVNSEEDISRFCEETGLPVALDETIDNMRGDFLDKLVEFVHPGIVAVVIKPSLVGGFENAALVARWAQQHGKMAVVSGAFESSICLSSFVQFAHYLDLKSREICRMRNQQLGPAISHGLGTFRWLSDDVTTESLKFCFHPNGGAVEASVDDAGLLLRSCQLNHEAIQKSYKDEQLRQYTLAGNFDGFSYSFNVWDTGISQDKKTVIFLHGFLGTGEDWVPIMKALSTSSRCISIDLPGHGKSQIQRISKNGRPQGLAFSFEEFVEVLLKLIHEIAPERVVLVGYSMGARIALYMALQCGEKIAGAVIISGSPGIKDPELRRIRAAQDDAKADYLVAHGLKSFLKSWYSGELWLSLRCHPHFERTTRRRMQHGDIDALARALSALSVGRQPPMWEEMKTCKRPLLLIVGEKDKKFKRIAQQMKTGEISRRTVEVPKCGHAPHLESPLCVITAISKFLRELSNI